MNKEEIKQLPFKIAAVDFDGTLVENAYPEIGKAKIDVFDKIIKMQNNGWKIILWTCRGRGELEEAIDFCKSYGLIFDAVNENLKEHLVDWPEDTRKIYADIYIDDKAINVNDF